MSRPLLWRLKWYVASPIALLIGIAWLSVLRGIGLGLGAISYLTSASFGIVASALAVAFLLRLSVESRLRRLACEAATLAGIAALIGALLGFTILITPQAVLQQPDGIETIVIPFAGPTYLGTTLFSMGLGLASAVAVRVFAHLYAAWNRLRQRRLLWELTHVQVRLVVVVMAVLLLGWIAVLMINLQQFGDDPSAQITGVMSTLVLVSGMLGIATGIGMVAVGIPASLLSFFTARRITRRLDNLTEAAQLIRRGHTSARVQIAGEDEVAQLQADFNAMAEALEQALTALQAERDAAAASLESRRTLFASVSHELRTPVATLRGYLESLRNRSETDPDVRRDLEVVERETLRLQRMIDDVFALARLDVDQLRLDMRPVEPGQVLARVASAARMQAWQSSKIELILDVEPPLPLVMVDEARLEQALHNLLRNASRHTLPGGVIVLSATPDDTHVRIDVRDTGEGIDPDRLPHIWERFNQDSDHGADPDRAGLGLSLVKELAEAMGGSVAVESALGAGSTFSIHLPRISSV